jgi:hypothetical protein
VADTPCSPEDNWTGGMYGIMQDRRKLPGHDVFSGQLRKMGGYSRTPAERVR